MYMKIAFLCLLNCFSFDFILHCGATAVVQIVDIKTALPTQVAYWPLNKEFTILDGGGNDIDASHSGAFPVTYVNGPFGVTETAQETAPIGNTGYISLSSASVNVSTGSWTLSAYVNAQGLFGPIFEWYNTVTDAFGMNLWHFTATNRVYINFNNPGEAFTTCTMSNWVFLGVTYNTGDGTIKVFCNETYSPAFATVTVPMVTNDLLLGYRAYTSGTRAVAAQFACVSIYSASLTANEMLEVKKLCPLYQSISCSVNCMAGTCRPDVTRPEGYECQCKFGYTGYACTTKLQPDVSQILTIQSTLPSLIAYWPLTKELRATDSSSNAIHGVYEGTYNIGTDVGPFGLADSALQTAPPSNDGYVNFTSPALLLGPTSWTLSTYVYATAINGPIFEWLSNGITQTHLWQNPSVNNIFVNPTTSATTMNVPCTMSGVWQFVAVSYNNALDEIKIFCNDTYFGPLAPAQGAPPITGHNLLMGRRSNTLSANFTFACASIFNDALNVADLLVVKQQLCPLYEHIHCSPNCVEDTCIVDTTNTDGYRCTCKAGWTGLTCKEALCDPSCPLEADSLCTTVNPDFSVYCPYWKNLGHCLSNPTFMWTSCQTSCTKYSTCECSVLPNQPFDLNCTCGDLAIAGLCEADLSMTANCTYTCGRRLDSSLNCTSEPLGVTLPGNSSWSLSVPPSASFVGVAAYLQTAIMECNIGYAANDYTKTGMHICNPIEPTPATGNWIELITEQPSCYPMICADPPIVADATYVNYTSSDNFFIGDIVTYSCRSDLVLESGVTPEANCSFIAPCGWTWASGKAPRCIKPPCQPAIAGTFATWNVSANETGGVLTYSCNLGYVPSSDLNEFAKVCQNDGSWLPAGAPECSIVRCPVPDPESDSYLTGTRSDNLYSYGDTINVYCTKGSTSLFIEPGTESTPLSTIVKTCLDSGLWTPNKLECLRVSCETPEKFQIADYRIMNASADIETLLYGSIIAFECDWNQGLEPSENETNKFAYWHCNENSTWDTQELKCSRSGFLKPIRKQVVVFYSTEAVATATTVLAVLGAIFGIIVCLDYLTIRRDLRILKRNWRNFVRRLRDIQRLKELHMLRNRVRGQVNAGLYLQKLEVAKEKLQLQMAGFSTNTFEFDADVDNEFLVKNPLEFNADVSHAHSAGQNYFKSEHHYIEGEMEIAENDRVEAEK